MGPSRRTAATGASEGNVTAVARLEAEHLHARTAGERAGDLVARVAGNGWFAVGHVVWFGAWIVVNLGYVRAVTPFGAVAPRASISRPPRRTPASRAR